MKHTRLTLSLLQGAAPDSREATIAPPLAFAYRECREEALALTVTEQQQREGYICDRHNVQTAPGELCPMCCEALALAVYDACRRWKDRCRTPAGKGIMQK